MAIVWRLCGYRSIVWLLWVRVWGERLKAISGEDIAFRVSELTSY